MNWYRRSMNYFSKHPMLNSIAHSCGGFGLAIILQEYLKGNAFLPLGFGWILVLISVVIHIHSMMK